MKRVLVISHNVFCETSNMGKTLKGYFKNWDTDKIVQLYIHSEIPTDSVCKNYYSITDKDIIKSVFKRKSGVIYTEADIYYGRTSSRTDSGLTSKIYQSSRKRTPIIYFLRNLLWTIGKWNTKKLNEWIDTFNPEVVFFASGDYTFMYKIALKISKQRNIPLVVSCMDDYYIYNKNNNKILGKTIHKSFMRYVTKTMEYASCVVSICDKMSGDYTNMFNVPCVTIHTSSSFEVDELDSEESNKISYIGNLGYNRNKQLVDIGKALISTSTTEKPLFVDVYSSEIRPEVLCDLIEENGIKFHGEINSDEVKKVMSKSMFLIHTESFEENIKNSIMYSVSTKIADSLASGKCIIAYGPQEIASIKYLMDNNAAFCITDSDSLVDKLKVIISDNKLRNRISNNGVMIAEKNHNSQKNCEKFKKIIDDVVSGKGKKNNGNLL